MRTLSYQAAVQLIIINTHKYTIFISHCCSNVIKYLSHIHLIASQTAICGIYVPFVSGLTTTCMQCILCILPSSGLGMVYRVKAFAHYRRKCQKCSYLPYTLQLFATFFSTVSYIGNNFHNNFFWKIFAFLCVVCRGLNHAVIQVNQVLVATP